MKADNMELSYTDSISYNDDTEEVYQILQDMRRFQFTGLENIANDAATDDSWEVESYAVDSMELNKQRLPHITHDDMDSSISQGSAPPFVVVDADDWTVKSECNDSIRLTQDRLDFQHEQHNEVRPALARINRRRASMRDMMQEEEGLVPPSSRGVVRRYSLSSVHTADDSLSSSDSNDPAGRRASLTRNKSMPIKKTTPMDPLPLWSAENTKSQKMERRFSNNGRPCAA